MCQRVLIKSAGIMRDKFLGVSLFRSAKGSLLASFFVPVVYWGG